VRPLLSAVLILGACASSNAVSNVRTADCGPNAPADAASFKASRLTDLTGTFRMVHVLTSFPVDSVAHAIRRSSISLQLPDSAQLALSRESSLGRYARRNLQLTGTWDWSDSVYPLWPAEMDSDTLYLGCRDCIDASPYVLLVAHVSQRGFWGRWRDYQTGIGTVFDQRTGARLPDPAGFFCAIRT
jgi:hypothetical protein